jgi:Fic family protein
VSSYALANAYDPLVGFRLSYSIKDKIREYYTGFPTCERKLNRGDLTPFVIMFSEFL